MRRENSLKVVEITKSGREGVQCGCRCGAGVPSGSCWEWVVLGVGRWRGSTSGSGSSPAQPPSADLPLDASGWLGLASRTHECLCRALALGRWEKERRARGLWGACVWPCPHLAGGLPGWLLWHPGPCVPRSRYGLRKERHCLWGVGVHVSVRWAGSWVLTSVKCLTGARYSLKDLTCVSSLGPRGNLVR